MSETVISYWIARYPDGRAALYCTNADNAGLLLYGPVHGSLLDSAVKQCRRMADELGIKDVEDLEVRLEQP